jgi:hypothetical protein
VPAHAGDCKAEQSYGAVGKAGWLTAVALILWVGPDPPIAVMLPQPSPFLLLRSWLSGYAFMRWFEIGTK